MKRIIVMVISILFVLGFFTACGGGKDDFPKPSDNVVLAESDFDSHGWKGKIAITFDRDDITKVDFDEINKDGDRKSKDQTYAENMKPASGITPAEAYEQLEKQLVENQEPSEVDVVSGATSSSKLFVELAKEALSKR